MLLDILQDSNYDELQNMEYHILPSFINQNSFCTFQKESQHQRMCSNVAKSDANKYQCGGHATENINAPKKSRPFQTVEKICSALMAILFLMFNALYWPWLLREGDFDYEKFEKAVVKEDA